MNTQPYIEFDQQLLLLLNGSDSLFWDGLMWIATSTYIWIPVAIILLYIIFKNNTTKEALIIVGLLILLVILSDQISSGFCKPFFARYRPTQDPELMYMIDIVNGYRGGKYGFISSHASYTFAIATFMALVLRNSSSIASLFVWAILCTYSRIYLGVHYPGDVLFGIILGISIASALYILYHFLQRKYLVQSHYISNQYTSSGYLINDIHLLNTTMILTIFVIIIGGFISSHYLYF